MARSLSYGHLITEQGLVVRALQEPVWGVSSPQMSVIDWGVNQLLEPPVWFGHCDTCPLTDGSDNQKANHNSLAINYWNPQFGLATVIQAFPLAQDR